MIDLWELTKLIDDIRSPTRQLQAIEHAQELEKEHVCGAKHDTLKGILAVMKVKALLHQYLVDQEELVVVDKPRRKPKKQQNPPVC